MKSYALVSCLALVFLAKAAFGAAPAGWTESYRQALAQAQAQHKNVLLDFTGSDWCGWCQKIDAEVFATQQFKDYAAKYLVLVKLDFPNSIQQSAELKAQNKMLQQTYHVTGFPTLVIVDQTGKRIWSQTGYAPGGPENFIKSASFAPAEGSAVASAPEGWTENYAQALAQAQADHKKVLLDFTGSDWCTWCQKIDAEVFATQQFKDYAAKNLVLVKVDFPHSLPQSEELKMRNKSLEQQYHVSGFPTLVLVNHMGKKLWAQSGYAPGGPEAFIKAVQEK